MVDAVTRNNVPIVFRSREKGVVLAKVITEDPETTDGRRVCNKLRVSEFLEIMARLTAQDKLDAIRQFQDLPSHEGFEEAPGALP